MKVVMVIDDLVATVELLKHYLIKAGIEVLDVLNAEAALDMLEHQTPDIIICDINMPGMGGIGFIKKVREMHKLRNTPIVAITVLALERDRQRALAAGFSGYITKPVNPATIVADLRAFMPLPDEL